MDEMKNIGGEGLRPIFIDKQTGYLLTYDPALGKHVPVLGSDTFKPIKNRMVYVDALTGCYCAIDMKTGHVTDVIDPATNKPMTAKLVVNEDDGKVGEAGADAGNAVAIEFDEEALVQADADDGSALESGPSRREGEPSLMELIEQMEEEAAAGKAAEPAPEPELAASITPAATAAPLSVAKQYKQPDYMKMLPHINTRDASRMDGAETTMLITVAATLVIVFFGQMLYWALF